MSQQVDIGPYTNFEEIFTYYRCPARLYLKLAGFRSEILRRYTPPSISPSELGKEGELMIENGFKRKIEINVPETTTRKIRLSRRLDRILMELRKITVENIKALFWQIENMEVYYSPLKLSEEAKKLKKDFKVNAIISKVNFTTIPHHRVGQVDFLGLKENREVIIIEVKNIQRNISNQDRLQLEYYIDGLPKQYQYTKVYSHLNELVSQLYPKKSLDLTKFAKCMDLIEEEISNLNEIIASAISTLGDIEKEKFLSLYNPKDDLINERSTNILLPIYEGLDHEYLRLLDASEKFLETIPEYVHLKEILHQYQMKTNSLIEDFKSTADFIVELMEKGIKNGLIVDIRRSKIIEVSKSIDFDEIVKGVWQIKKSVYENKKIAPKNYKACANCNFKSICKNMLKDGEPEQGRSITSVVHKGFEKLNLKYNEPKIITWVSADGVLRIDYRATPRTICREFNMMPTEELLKKALEGTEWMYTSQLARRVGWKQLYVDAIVSKKLEKEFTFWRL
ncbi:MAG: PD-(D/E)XK nuclease family protein [Nitrososphaeria archaeon]